MIVAGLIGDHPLRLEQQTGRVRVKPPPVAVVPGCAGPAWQLMMSNSDYWPLTSPWGDDDCAVLEVDQDEGRRGIESCQQL
jgi:hypothetical protein